MARIVTIPAASGSVTFSKPRVTNLSLSQPAQNWYTIIDITNGKGLVNKITACSAVSFASMQIKLTIDGVETIFSMGNRANGLAHGVNATYPFTGTEAFDYFCNIAFTQSFKAELYTGAYQSSQSCDASIQYMVA